MLSQLHSSWSGGWSVGVGCRRVQAGRLSEETSCTCTFWFPVTYITTKRLPHVTTTHCLVGAAVENCSCGT